MQGGTELTQEELLERGVNHSVVHEDVMIGAADTRIIGVAGDGRRVTVFEDGVWAL